MSPAEKDRKLRSISGITFPDSGIADAISKALHREFDGSGSAVKTVAALTGVNQRSVKNWFEGKNAPSGACLVRLCSHSPEVLHTFLLLAGQNELAAAAGALGLRERVREFLALLDGLSEP